MDASRFDALTKSLTARLTRRTGLGLLGAFGLSARVDLAGIDAKKRGKKKNKKKKPKCTVSNSGTATTTSFTVTNKDLSLTSTDTIQHAGGALTSTTVIRQKRAQVLQMTASFQGDGLGTIELLYGKGYKGIARAVLTSDGTTVSGTVDGRAIVPFAASTQPTSLQFQDGQPAPTLSLSPKLNRQLTQLNAKAAAQAQTCSGVSAQLHESRLCLSCVAGCAVTATLALKAAAAGCAAASALCVFAAPACFAGCMAVALVTVGLAAEVCVDLCARNPCCAVPCHHTNGDPFCCEEGETCLRPGACCRAGLTPCGGETCCPSPDRCLRGACCLHPDFVCGSTCVGPFTTCCGGTTVCTNGVCIGNSCCTGGYNCGGFCCQNANRCCNNVCCQPGQVCDSVTGACSANCAFRCGPSNECCQTGDVCCGGIHCQPRAVCPN
jgi:hypothetical protein